jgi:hypothetical protein
MFVYPKRKPCMQNYNTDSTKPLPKANDEIAKARSPEYQEGEAQFSESEKESIRRRRWLESISDCV